MLLVFFVSRDDLDVTPFNPELHRHRVERIQVWGDIVLVGDYGQHSLMTQDFMAWTRTPEGADYAIEVQWSSSPRPRAGSSGQIERSLGCVAGYVGQKSEYWSANPSPDQPLRDSQHVTPPGIRPAMRKLFRDLGIIE